ncbi:MAG TPA: hypothetical protein VMS23_09715, partial [Terrimicrobiaceae bacterium]|nr:hypothetical protein [Terrimicrobiaceae bacterium]
MCASGRERKITDAPFSQVLSATEFMTSEPSIVAPALDLAVRIGCELVYDTTAEVPALVTMKP